MSAIARADQVMRALRARYRGRAESAKATPWKSLLFTVLSARSRDVETEKVYRMLLARYPTPQKLARATPQQVAPLIARIGLFRSKAKNVVALARRITADHGGKVPADLDALVELPGVGRKTANCVLVYAFGIPAVCVDTHVHRIANRLGWVKTRTPEQTERALRAALAKRHWLNVNHTLIQFGRDICVPRKPQCWRCPVARWCSYRPKTPHP
ncbi:MAG: endonuclease III [Lysobacteraceae bacterium]|nr:MAG: endonuclease III [Xanthomonadaceae bacterium]